MSTIERFHCKSLCIAHSCEVNSTATLLAPQRLLLVIFPKHSSGYEGDYEGSYESGYEYDHESGYGRGRGSGYGRGHGSGYGSRDLRHQDPVIEEVNN